jgi:hypothetical protein
MNTKLKTFKKFNEASSNVTNSELKSSGIENYMFFENLKTIKSLVDNMLLMDPTKVDSILQNGHDWAEDHVATAKENLDQVGHFLSNQ